MNADRREEKPTGGGRQRMKPAWKEQTGGLREEGKSKMAQKEGVAPYFWDSPLFYFILKVQKEPRKIALGLEAE